jgi:hypothetical protein
MAGINCHPKKIKPAIRLKLVVGGGLSDQTEPSALGDDAHGIPSRRGVQAPEGRWSRHVVFINE